MDSSTPTTLATATTTTPKSRLLELWNTYQAKSRKLDDLERRMDAEISRKRRRIVNLLDETSTHRRSHLRLFVTHFDSSKVVPVPVPVAPPLLGMDLQQQQQQTPKKQLQWTLVIEGKLLVGHLDHDSVDFIEAQAREKMKRAFPQSNDESVFLTRSTDRTLYRGKNEQEGDVPVERIHFTHFFDQLTVSLQAIHQPVVQAKPPPLKATPKKSRKKQASTTTTAADAPPYIPDKDLMRLSPPTVLTWNRGRAEGEGHTRHVSSTAATTQHDAHAWYIPYTPPPPSSHLELHSVVATIQLTPRHGPEAPYKLSHALSQALFPQHPPEPLLPTKRKKKKRPSNAPQHELEAIPRDNDIDVPATLTLKEIVSGFFYYVKFHQLQDASEPLLIRNDATLQSLFGGMESFHFSNLQQLLLEHRLVTLATLEPIKLTYIMTADGVSPSPATTPTTTSSSSPNLISLDCDVQVPRLFPYRARELLRRIKRREFEYTSARTKARQFFLREDDTTARSKLEDCVVGRGFTLEHVPLHLSLAKAAPVHSEARASSQMDAKACVILSKLEEHVQKAQAAWQVVEALRK